MQDRPTGGDRRGTFTELSTEECYRKLSQAVGIGRIGLCTSDGPLVLPVNYLVDGETLLVRTAPYTVIAEHASGPVALEVDDLEPALKFGWSVLVVGEASRVEDVEEMVELRTSGRLEPWAEGTRGFFIRITPRGVTGRQIG
ncbi:MAG: pyridoxamine 5'-phosphate oxidase family protein [Nocardioidaceae bacterium]